MDVNVFRNALKDLEDDPEGMVIPDTHRHSTESTLSGVTYARQVEILPPYTVEFENGMYQVECVGANHNILDRKVVNSVSLVIGNSAGLISVNTGGGSGASAADVWSYNNRSLTSGAVIADAVWDEMLSGHDLPGSYGNELATVSDIQASVATDIFNYVSGSIVVGLLNSGTIANTVVRDGNYWTISETDFGLTVEFVFNLPSLDHRPGAFSLFGRYDGKGSSHYLEVWFWNVEALAWEQLQEKFIPNGTTDKLYSSNYNEQHIDRANNHEVKVRIVHNMTSYSTNHDLYVDSCHLTAINILEPCATPQQFWEYGSRTLTPNVPTAQENADAVATHPETLTVHKYIGLAP